MSSIRSTVLALSVATLVFSAGSSSSANTDYSHPQFTVADDRTLSLRESGSRLVVDTIENALRQGGIALFDERFQIDSSLDWVLGEDVSGELDAVIPLWSKGRHNVFTQPGFVLWKGLADDDRIDGNLGVVYRTETIKGIIGGASLFYDHDFQIGHSRLGIGVDAQKDGFYGAFNYYHPLSDTQDAREGYVEDALQGMDASVAVESDVTRVGGNVGYWLFQGDEDVEDEWEFSYGLDAGLRLMPGVFLEGRLERHDKTASFGRRASVGLAFRFTLPNLDGKSYGDGGKIANLYRPVDREKRILYEEREASSPVRLTPLDENGMPLASTSAIEEGDTATTVTIAGELEALPVSTMLELVIDETASSAELGVDFNYGHKVYELNAETGEQSAPDTTTGCLATVCDMPIPAGVTRFDVEVEILPDSDDKEVPEEIVLRVNVPEEHQRAIRNGETTVTIQAHGNEIAFAPESATTLAENNETDGVQVSVGIDKPSPVPIMLNVATSGTATAGEDYRISTTSLRIPANSSSASLTLWGIDNPDGEGSKNIVLTISGDLPTGWSITDNEHMVTLQDDDLSIFFTSATPSRLEEPASDQSVTITVGITQAPTADIKVRVAADTSASSAKADDYTFTATELTFSMGSATPQTATLMLLADTVAEGEDETIVLTLNDGTGTQAARQNDGFSFGANHTITIPANDNTVAFASGTSTLAEGDSTMTEVTVNVTEPADENITLNVTVLPASTATEGTDYTIDSKNLTIRAEQSSGTITLRGRDDGDSEGNETIMLEISEPSGSPLPTGWNLGSQTTHTVTLQDDDLSIGFAVAAREVAEPDSGTTTFTVAVELTVSPEENVTVPIGIDTAVTDARISGGNPDVTYTPTSLTFASGTTELSKNITFTVHADTTAESDNVLRLLISNHASYTAGANNFSVGQESFTLTIPANDNLAQLSQPADKSFEEGESISFSLSSDHPAPDGGVPIVVTVTPQGSASAGDISFTANQVIPAGQTSVTFAIDAIDDDDSEADEEFEVSIAEGANFPSGWGSVVSNPVTITIPANDLPTVSLNYSGSRTVPENDRNNLMTIELSEALTENIMINIIATGDAVLGNGLFLKSNPTGGGDYALEVERSTGWELCSSITTESPCQITIEAGTTTFNIRFRAYNEIPFQLEEGLENATFSINVDAQSESLAQLGTPSMVAFTITDSD